ncbi:carotenoid oxygenase [Trichoderma chlorosporum]
MKAGANSCDVSESPINPLALGLYETPEVRTPIGLSIVGKIPPWVKGSLYRGAAGTWDSGNYTAEHWFDGFSRNHRFEIADGRVMYRSRNASDEVLDFVRETGLYPGHTFGGDPCKVIFGAFETSFRDGNSPVGNTSSQVVGVSWIPDFGGLPNASVHGPLLQQIDPTTLEPIEISTYQASNPALINGAQAAAHPAYGANGEIYNYIMDPTAKSPTYKVFRVDTNGVGQVLATITDAPAAYIHALFSTENYLVLIVWQADFGPTPKPTNNILDSLKPWDDSRQTLFYVISKANGTVMAKYTSDSFFAFHEINSFEDKETESIIIDLPTMPTYEFLEAARLENLRANVGRFNTSAKHDLPCAFSRYRLPGYTKADRMSDGTLIPKPAVLDHQLDQTNGNIELPRINDAYHGLPYQYAYGIHVEKPGYFADSIIKVDTKSWTTKIWAPSVDHLPSEPIFVPRPNSTDEDDGVLLTVALDAKRRLSSLIVIDAKNMEELARAEMPLVVGYGFHGIWGGA